MATSSAPPRSRASTRVEALEAERLVGAGDQHHVRRLVRAHELDAREVVRLRVAEQEHARVRTLRAQPGRRQHRRREDLVVGEREPGLAQHHPEPRPAAAPWCW